MIEASAPCHRCTSGRSGTASGSKLALKDSLSVNQARALPAIVNNNFLSLMQIDDLR
jgi:hypothetical protein